MLHYLDCIEGPCNTYRFAVKDGRKNGRHTPAKNNGFGDVYNASEPAPGSEQAEVEEQDGGLDGSDVDRVVYLADPDGLVDRQL